MHRISSIPGDSKSDEFILLEQPTALILFLTSANTDIATFASAIKEPEFLENAKEIRAVPLASLDHQAQVDHYLATTASKAKLIVVRLLGGRGHWSYGLEQLINWQKESSSRNIIIMSGIKENELELHSISSISNNYVNKLSLLLREGGLVNVSKALTFFIQLAKNKPLNKLDINVYRTDDPERWDWKNDGKIKIGIIHYKSMFKACDIEMPLEINRALRLNGFSPRTLLISSLRNKEIQEYIRKIFIEQKVMAIISSTSFSSGCYEDSTDYINIWKDLKVPTLQILTSSGSREDWIKSDYGLNSLDLSLQIVLPEVDGRITTRPCSFKEIKEIDTTLSTNIYKSIPDKEGIEWLVKHIKSWINIRTTPASDKKLGLVLANYPIRNGRIANGVGLDTPASTIEVLNILKNEGYYLGEKEIPNNGNELIKCLISGRTNDPESFSNKPLTYISLEDYLLYWQFIPLESRQKIIKRWGQPDKSIDIEDKGFSINGIQLGNIIIMVQPSRGYDCNSLEDLHSPDLAPPHRYVAQYIWMKQIFKVNLVINIGKHGSLEWLPGKGVGISKYCFPEIILGTTPNIYPFIVNDPGEGSQAKRRTQAIIIDHLTPPLARAELYGDLLKIEALMDEYTEAKALNSKRVPIIEKLILQILEQQSWPGFKSISKRKDYDINQLPDYFNDVDSYLCELKETQIRTGLHILGKLDKEKDLTNLLLSISRSPNISNKGITQHLANIINVTFDPWVSEEGDYISEVDKQTISKYTSNNIIKVGDGIAWLEEQAFLICQIIVNDFDHKLIASLKPRLIPKFIDLLLNYKSDSIMKYIIDDVWPRLYSCAEEERKALIDATSGYRIESGPSGAPTRGRPEVLPTGRNFYSVDLRGLPTESAWDLGKRSAEKLIQLHLLEHGESLTHVGMSVWGTSTMRNGGEDICQLLALIGVKPIWDGPSRRVIDLEIIPINILERNRVDVTLRISGLFRDAFPQLIELVYRAQNMISLLNEDSDSNPLAATYQLYGPQQRIFGSAPGAYGAGLQAIIDSGNWEKRSDLANAYMSWSQWSYEGNNKIKLNRVALESALTNIQVVLHNQDNREHDLLDSDDYYQFHGGMASAVEKVSGKLPSTYFGDHSRRERPKVHKLSDEIDKVVRSRLLNPKWIKGMLKHGYKGSFEFGASLDYLFAYDAATDCVPDWCYSQITNEWIKNDEIKNELLKNNPWALRDMCERLLEASNRGLWKNIKLEEKDFLIKEINSTEAFIESQGMKILKTDD